MNDQEKYALYQDAQKRGGPCPICNWKDGDGVRTCFYSKEVGIVTHQNSHGRLNPPHRPNEFSTILNIRRKTY